MLKSTVKLSPKGLFARAGVATAAILALVFGAVAPANASQSDPSADKQATIATKAVTTKDGVRQFDYTKAVKNGLTTKYATEFAGGFAANGGTVVGGPADLPYVDELSLVNARAACAGRNGFSVYWWGSQSRIDSCRTNMLIGALTAGAGTAALLGILSVIGAVPSGVVAALGAIGAGALAMCNAYGKGIYLNQVWGMAPGCWSQ